MTFEHLADRTARWLDGSGERSDLVISSRIRLARNLKRFPFSIRASIQDKQGVLDAVGECCRTLQVPPEATFFEAVALTNAQRQLLVERHLISPTLADAKGPRGVWVEPDEVLSLMVNEEDHLRFQAIVSGFQPHQAWDIVHKTEQTMGSRLGFAYKEPWGYLTACPTNVGTGLRASILIHLPGLVLTQEMEGVTRGVAQMGFTVRGLYGEGSDAAGNLFQVSNQVTLGLPASRILEQLERVTGRLAEFEANARQTLLRDARVQMEDKMFRALGILQNARMLTSQEFLNLSSAARMGVGMGLLSGLHARLLNELMVLTKPSHLQQRVGRQLESHERDRIRAEMVRSRLAQHEN